MSLQISDAFYLICLIGFTKVLPKLWFFQSSNIRELSENVSVLPSCYCYLGIEIEFLIGERIALAIAITMPYNAMLQQIWLYFQLNYINKT